MSNWLFKDVYKDVEAGFEISKSVSKYGDAFSGQCSIEGSNDARPIGLHFLTKGSVVMLDADGNHDNDYSSGELFSTSTLEAANKGKVILISKESTEYWCIADIPPITSDSRHWTGTLTALEPNETAVIGGILGKRVFLPKAANVDGVDYPKHTVLKVDSKDTITVINGTVSSCAAVFWVGD